MKKMLICFAAMVILLLSGVKAFSGNLECYGYTSTTNHFECGTHGNCVWWTAYMRPDIAAVISGSGWNGDQWYDNLENDGFDVGLVPKVGSIVAFSNAPVGHVAYVTGLGENGSFSVSEMDYYGTFGNGVQYAVYSPVGSTYKRNGSGSWILQGFIYRNPSVDNSYCADINSLWGICWKPSDTDVSCQGGSDWRLYDYEQGSVIIVSTNEYCPEPGGSGGGGVTPTPQPTPQPTNSPNLQVREITVYDANGVLLTERETVLIPGEVLDIRINVISLEEDCQNGMEADKDTVETDVFFKIALGDDLGSYQYLGRVYSEVYRLTEDNHHIEHFSYTVPTSAAGQRIYFRALVDSTSEVTESNEDDNYSGSDEWYAVEGDCDIIITKVALANGKTALNEGEHYGIEAFISNLGTTTCPFSTRLVYYEQKPGQTTWTEMATDGTDVAELVPNYIKHEYTTGEPFIADTPGTHNLMACGDYLKDQPETNENNNCTISQFTVNSNKPNFYINKIYFKVGSTTYQNGATIARNSYVKPYVQIGNNGTSSLHNAFRVAYYVNADKFRDSDGVDADQICIGCVVTEYVSEGFKLGDRGTRTYKACLDYEGKVSESNETDNCQTITFYLK